MSRRSNVVRAAKFDAATMRHAPRFMRDIRAEKNRYIDAQISYFRKVGNISQALEAEHGNRMFEIYRQNYRRIMKSAAEATPDTIDGVKSGLRLEIKQDYYEDALRDYYTRYGGARAKNTATTTTADIRRLLMSAFEDGEPENVVVSRGLRAKALSAWRADVIARTETHIAAAFAADYTARQIARENEATLMKAWQPVIDDRTREAHAEMDGDDWIAEESYFTVGGEKMLYPGDPSGSPENVINCRCACLRQIVVQ